MNGRLGMTGSSVVRGDKAVGVTFTKALTPEEIQERIKASQARKIVQPPRARGHQGKVAAAQAAAPKPVAQAARKTKVPLKLLMPTGKQYANWAIDAALVGGGIAAGRHQVKKDDRTRNTAAGAAVAGGATDLGLNVGGWVNRETIKHHERKVDAGILPHPMTRNQRKDVLSAHKAKYGFAGDIHDAGNAYYRNFPKGMPAWKRKRMVGFKNHPGAVVGMVAAGTAAGAIAGHARKTSPVTKARTLVKPTAGQLKTWAATAAGAGAAGTLAHHERQSGLRGTATAAGAASGAAAIDAASGVGGYLARERIQQILSRPENKRTKTTRKILSEHKAKHGVVEGPGKKPPIGYYTGYPKGMPAGRAIKVMGIKNHPGVVAATLATGGAAGALVANRRQKTAVDKARVVSEAVWSRATRGYLRRTKPKVYAKNPLTRQVTKAETTMSDHEAKRLSGKYDTRGPLPKGLDRETKMKAYEARYIASGGKKGEKWKRRADHAEVGRNIGLAGATGAGAALLAARGKTGAKLIAKVPKLTAHKIEGAALASGVGGGAAELYGTHARHRRASYANSPAGIAGSALTRMRAYTPGGAKT